MSLVDPVALTQELVRLKTINPPGDESLVADHLAGILEGAGFDCRRLSLSPGRDNLVARIGDGEVRPLCFSGHMDTVPLGEAPWSRPPLGGEIEEGRLYGRGASDMKAGLAALTSAACRLAEQKIPRFGLVLVFSVGEETGCQGAGQLAREKGLLGPAGAMVVAEPTSNLPFLGHKGAVFLRAAARGKTAHGSMPEKGENAIYKAARAVIKAQEMEFGVEPHPFLGRPTINVGTISGGTATNVVPDWAEFSLDIRTVPGQEYREVLAAVAGQLGPEVELSPRVRADGIWTEADDPWIGSVYDLLEERWGQRPQPKGATYFTDGQALVKALGKAPVLILGPGRPEMAHQTDEYCEVEKIAEAAEIYFEIGRAWRG